MISTPETQGDPNEAEPRTRVRPGNPETSHQAAEALTNGILRDSQQEVYDLLSVFTTWPGHLTQGLTDDELRREIIARHGVASKSGPATRRNELARAGWARILLDGAGAPVKRPSDGGRPMLVWVAVPQSEWVEPMPPEPVDPVDPAGLAVARRVARWEFGDAEMGERIVRAYLNPQAAQAALDEEMSDD